MLRASPNQESTEEAEEKVIPCIFHIKFYSSIRSYHTEVTNNAKYLKLTKSFWTKKSITF